MICPRCGSLAVLMASMSGGGMRVAAFLTEYAVVDRIIRHLALMFVAETPPPSDVFEQPALMAGKESGEHE